MAGHKMITMAQALMIRKLYIEGEHSMLNIAEQVGVGENTVRRIVALDDAEWDKFRAKREKHEAAPAKPRKAAPKKPEPEPEPEEKPAGKCPKCGAVKADPDAPWCWRCGADLRSEKLKTVINLGKIADVLNKAIELLEAER